MFTLETDRVDRNNPIVAEMLRVGIPVKRAENLQILPVGRNLVVTTTLCPLYAPGPLRGSKLLMPPLGLYDSRVRGKWSKGTETFAAIKRVVDQIGGTMRIMFTFADRGVIVNDPTTEDPTALVYHQQIYWQEALNDLRDLGISWEMQRYSDLIGDFPQFVDPSDSNEIDISRILPDYNKKARKIINPMLQQFGPAITYGLLQTYGTFDAITSKPNTLNLYFERGELLLNVTNLFPHKNYPRVDILC